jgi:hypothetical protein
VLQVPYPDPLIVVESSEQRRKTMHGEADYSRLWVKLYEDVVHFARNHDFAPLPDPHRRALRHRPESDSALGRTQIAPGRLHLSVRCRAR